MIEEETTGKLDFETLREAIERRDPDALLGFYTKDAALRIENAAHPDGLAFEQRGRAQIERYLRAICDQEMSCTVVGEVVVDEKGVEFVEVCEYPDGARISVSTTLELTEGRISRQLDVVERGPEDPNREVSTEGNKER
jgi:hypothetical protein